MLVKIKNRLTVAVAVVGLLAAAQPGAVFAGVRTGEELPPLTAPGLYAVYENNRAQGIPNYVTEDFLLLNYSMIQQRQIAETELQRSLPVLKGVFGGLAKSLAREGKSAATLANKDYLAVLTALAHGQAKVAGAGDAQRAQAELKLVLDAAGIADSPLWGHALDYSQFKPRGHYAGVAEAEAYFRASRYAGSVVFNLLESAATGVTPALADRLYTQAKQLNLLLGVATIRTPYRQLLDSLSWQFGQSDDLDAARWQEVTAKVKRDATPAEQRAAVLNASQTQHWQPTILGQIVDVTKLEAGKTWQDVTTGWVMLPQRRRADSQAFQALVGSEVGAWRGKDPVPFSAASTNGGGKAFPRADELMGALGSRLASLRLEQQGDTAYANYPAAAERAGILLKAASGLEGSQTKLMHNWLKAPFEHEFSDGRRLESMKAFWTWQRYAALLYAKQSYTPTSKSMEIANPRPGAWLAPAAGLYGDLLAMVKEHQAKTPHRNWDEFAAVLGQVVGIARSEVAGTALSEQDEAFLNELDHRLLPLVGSPDHPIVVDVHSDPGSEQVLEEATGWANVVHRVGKTGVAVGAMLSQHEFKQPMAQRMTDDEWMRKLLGVER